MPRCWPGPASPRWWRPGSARGRRPARPAHQRQHAPSPTDAFVLALSRARADAIITTGRILRAEPDVRYSPAGPTGLDRWRREAVGLDAAPLLVVLTAQVPDFDHPGLVEAPEVLVLTPAAWPAEAEAEARRRGIEHRALADLTLAATLAHLRDRGRRRISVEAGPTTARALFTGPALLDQLLLSTCRARACRRASRVRSSPGGRRSRRACPPAPPPATTEGGVRWTFELRHRGP
ncbi:MAG: dihydrofolate reductase family protein [bacterium]